jgi:hypothetical protein
MPDHALDGPQPVHHPPLGLGALLDQASNQAKHGLGICAGHGILLGMGLKILTADHAAGHH